MRDIVAYLGFGARLVVISAIVATAASATAQKAPPAFKNIPADCFKYPLTLPQNLMDRIATDCAKQYHEAPKVPAQLANAGLHAGTAYNGIPGKFVEAVALLEPVSKENRADPRVRTDAKFQLAAAYIGEGGRLPLTSPERGVLLGKGISALEDMLNTGVQKGTPLYSQVVFQRAKAYQNRGSNTLDYSNAIEGFAILADGGPGIDPALAAEAKSNLIEVALKAGANELRPDANDSPAAQRAASIYERGLRVDPRNLDLNLGLGDASLIIARAGLPADRPSLYDRARQAYANALQAASPGPKAMQANVGLARSTRGQGQLPQSIAYYQTATSGGADSRVVRELAETQVEHAGKLTAAAERNAAYRAAETTYQSLLKQAGLSNDDKAGILMTVADVQARQPGREADVRRTLLDAIAIAPGSTRAPLLVGMNLYGQSMFAEAQGHFQQVISLTGGATGQPAAGDVETRSQAFYYLSLINDRSGAAGNPSTLLAGVNNADAAIRTGSSKSPYREQACIARIIRGGISIKADEAASACASNDQADGMLLVGLFHLRKARTLSGGARTSMLNLGQGWFNLGLNEVARLASAAAADPTRRPAAPTFKWPGAGGVAAPAVPVMLKYGKAKVMSCLGGDVDIDLNPDEIRVAQEFFTFYGVEDCSIVP